MHAASELPPLLPGPLGHSLWRGSQLARSSSPGLASGFAALDAALPGGGWPVHGLTELLQAQAGVCEWRLLGPALRGLLAAAAQRPLLLIAPPQTPHLPGLADWGVTPRQLVWLDPATPQQALWAAEQAIKANAAAALMAWLPQARPEQIRRLQACALGSEAPVFLFRPASAARQSSAAPLRILLSPGADWELQLDILKRRGPALDAPLLLNAIPPALAAVLAPRLLRPQQALPTPPALLSPQPHHHALARPAEQPAGAV